MDWQNCWRILGWPCNSPTYATRARKWRKSARQLLFTYFRSRTVDKYEFSKCLLMNFGAHSLRKKHGTFVTQCSYYRVNVEENFRVGVLWRQLTANPTTLKSPVWNCLIRKSEISAIKSAHFVGFWNLVQISIGRQLWLGKIPFQESQSKTACLLCRL